MNTFSHVPPGFRFHPTDEELVDYYLRKKFASKRIDLDVIKDVDLYKIEPWDLQELCKIGTEEQNEWYFFSHKDKKYPTGTRTNRATKAGFWKATGRDKAIYSRHNLIGMRKTLVFYKGRAPNGQKSDWIMHEYRLETKENGTPQEEGWVVCRVFKKRMTTVRKVGDYESPCWYDDPVSFMPEQMDSPRRISHYPSAFPASYNHNLHHHHHHYACKQELELHYNNNHNFMAADPFFQLPQLESPKVPYASGTTAMQSSTLTQEDQQLQQQNNNNSNNNNNNSQQNLNSIFSITNNNNISEQAVNQVTDWRVLDKFVASQLSHDDQGASKDQITSTTTTTNFSNAVFHVADQVHINLLANDHHQSKRPEIAQDFASTSTSGASCQIDLWK